MQTENTCSGQLIGRLSESAHDVSGTVHVIDEKRIRIVDFTYDGEGPDAYFWAGTSTESPDGNGIIIPDERGTKDVLKMYSGQTVELTLPQGMMTSDLKWLSIWCRDVSVDFGHVIFPESLSPPAPAKIGQLSEDAHEVRSGDVIIVDSKTITINNFNYDGLGPDAFFLVGTGEIKASNGQKIPDELGRLDKLGAYSETTVTLKLPRGLFTSDIEWLSVYCLQAATSFGSVSIPDNINVAQCLEEKYYGNCIGSLEERVHGVRGKVCIIDESRIWLRHFSYDGLGPDAFFWVGVKGQHAAEPGEDGMKIPNERGSMDKLEAYADRTLILTLPAGTETSELLWISVWCRQAKVNFGSIKFPATLMVPGPVELGQFSELAHGVRSGKVRIIDKQSITIQGLFYDGQGPDAFFLVGKGEPSASGRKIPDETGSMEKLGSYSSETVTLRLPPNLSVDDIDYLSIFCLQADMNFGHVSLPESTYSVPPHIPSRNCEPMGDTFNVEWELMGDEIQFVFHAILGNDGYVAFGISGADDRSSMIGSDPMILFKSSDGDVRLVDYSINAYSLCAAGTGVCPDDSDDLDIVATAEMDSVTQVTFKRPLVTGDPDDRNIKPSMDQYVVWATGNVNDLDQVTKHKNRVEGNMILNFGRSTTDNCPKLSQSVEIEAEAWVIPSLQNQTTFVAQIGPTGGRQGFEAITGMTSWGIAWYLNGLLIPEIHVLRGVEYTFIVQGGSDPSNQAKHHPFYITDDPVGGYATKNDEQKQNVTIYAGLADGENAVDGPYCEFLSTENPDDHPTFASWQSTMDLTCDAGSGVGMFKWKVDRETPETVYYQCFTHNNLGWKIHVADAPPTDRRASYLNPDDAETALFVLVAICFVLFLATLMLGINYSGLKKHIRKGRQPMA